MKVQRFSTASYAEGYRDDAWRQCASEAGLAVIKLVDTPRFFAHASVVTTPDGAHFLHVSSRAQALGLERPDPRAACLVLLIEGRMSLRQSGEAAQEIGPGDVLYGGAAAGALFSFSTDFRALFVKLPRQIMDSRLMAPLPDRLELTPAHAPFGQVFASLLGSAATNLDDLSLDELRSVEAAVTEFLVTSVFSRADIRALGGADGRRAALLHRITASMDNRLSDPELSLADVAREHGISPRNLQKLFEVNGQNFTAYLRLRRLEKCRDDLADPRHSQLFIAEICYRWGFKDPAYFSRSFREQFGVSARDFRRAPHLYLEGPVSGWSSRGRPGKVGWAPSEHNDNHPLDKPPHADDADEAMDEAVFSGVREHHVAATPASVHWGYFSRFLPPILEVQSGEVVTVECLTHHAYDDYERMIKGDPGAESVFHWTAEQKNVNRRGAGPLDASALGRGAGEGFGVHICTGPIAVAGARPGDLLEVRILDIEPRASRNPEFEGRAFGSNAAAFWGFHYDDLLTEPKHREVVTIYELDCRREHRCAKAVYSFRWTPQTDPSGVVHPRIDYPGVPVDHTTIEKRFGVLKDVEVPVRPHFGVIGLAPDHSGLVDSVPPSYFGGNLDNWRLGKGAKVYLPVAAPGALLSVGDPHASQGDAEICGTAIECSLTGRFQLIVHKKRDLQAKGLADINYPLIETPDEWVISGFSHPDYLDELGAQAQSEVYKKASVDSAMRDAFRKARRFLMTAKGLTEDEAISLISVAVDFGVTQVVDGNWGVHAVIRKSMFRCEALDGGGAADGAFEEEHSVD